MTSTAMRAKDPIDLIAFASVATGFTPSESIVMLTFGRAQFHARLDIPTDPTRPEQFELASKALLDPCRLHGVENVAFILVTEDAYAAELAWAVLRYNFIEADINIIDSLHVTNGRWTRMWDTTQSGGADISTHPFIIQAAVEQGRVIHASREALRDTIAVRDTLDASWLPGPLPQHATDDMLDDERTSLTYAIEEHLSAGHFPSATLGTVLVGLNDPRLRDEVLRVLARQQDSRAHVTLWADACARAPHEFRAYAASIFAFACYMAGDGAGAWIGVDAALEIDAANSLGRIVANFLENALPPTLAARTLLS